MPVIQLLVLPVMGARNTAWNENVFCAFAVNFLAENAPEGRNLHLKFQIIFWR